MNHKVIINGKHESNIAFNDRGLQYGDGLFETIAFRNGKLQFWHQHLTRLSHGCQRLSLPVISEQQWLEDIQQLNCADDAVIKLIITRGSGGRGYKSPDTVNPTRIIACYDYPEYPSTYYSHGVNVALCKTPVSINSALSGIKHLNRLENVLARNEWQGSDMAEGLMFDDHGHVVEGTMSNLFMVQNGALYTPVLKKSGIEGVVRNQVIELAKEQGLVVQQIGITRDQLMRMEEVFLCNSLIGIWPVKQIEKNLFNKGPVTMMLMEKLNMEEGAHAL